MVDIDNKGDCPCVSCYIGETKGNAEVRLNEHNNPTKSSEPSKHLRSNINHCFSKKCCGKDFSKLSCEA